MWHICTLRLMLLGHMCIIALSKRRVFFAFEKQLLLYKKDSLNIKSIFYQFNTFKTLLPLKVLLW